MRLLAFVAAFVLAPASAAFAKSIDVSVLSTRADYVSGGDALVRVDGPPGQVKKLRVLRNGADVTAAFAPRDGGLVGLVDGLSLGENVIAAKPQANAAIAAAAKLTVTNHPISGPIFSGPHQTPFICRTAAAELGPPLDEDCFAPTIVRYHYRSTGGAFKPLADPAARPADLAQTTTRDGRTVDYVVRVETGVINRAIYRWATLAAGGETGNGWNGRLVYSFGGGCGTGYHQGGLAEGEVLDHTFLSQGYAKASASLNAFAVACNDVLSAETTMMVKERVIEALGAPPAWTMGQGGSGGSIQQLLLAQDYPGLLDGIVPSATFQDAQLAEPVDCRLLNRYFASPAGAGLTAAQRLAINGYRHAGSCPLWDGLFANVIVADAGCDQIVPESLRYNAVTNPTGARCTTWDSMVNVYGRDPSTGFARRTLDNVGVQYGLKAVQEGKITVDQFLDLNELVGGYDNDGKPRPQRAVADPEALAIAYRTGRLNQGAGGLPEVPILDVRSYTDALGDLHTYVHSYVVRERLRRATGSAANHVMWRAGGGGTTPMSAAARELMAEWLDNLVADTSDRPQAEKVVDAKPASAVDACWTAAGVRIDDPAEIDATGPCTALYQPFATPRIRAGAPLHGTALKCELRPVDPSEYGPPLTPAQEARLNSVFPDGVCDWSRPGVSAQPFGGAWQSFGGG